MGKDYECSPLKQEISDADLPGKDQKLLHSKHGGQGFKKNLFYFFSKVLGEFNLFSQADVR